MHKITLIAEDESPVMVEVEAPRYEDAVARLAAALTRLCAQPVPAPDELRAKRAK
jgi:hypothetical protein